MPAVKFTHQGSSSVLGNFSAGDIYRGDAAICRHLVEEARCAKWLDEPTERVAVNDNGLRADGPTVAEFVAAGYRAENYPPAGYASRSTEAEIADAVAAQAAADAAKKQAEQSAGKDKFTSAQLREALTAKGIPFKASAPKAELQALLDAAGKPAE